MFDIGFWEIALIAVIALLVVGPERLPALARTLGFWVGRARRFVASVKSDFDKELRTQELQEILNKQNASRGVYDIVEETRRDVKEVVDDLNKVDQDLQDQTDTSADDGELPPAEPSPTPPRKDDGKPSS